MSYLATTDSCAVRCVRGTGAPTGPRFDTSTAGVVKDNETQLTWEAAPPVTVQTLAEATTHCANLGLLGGGWRLPTIRELATSIDPLTHSPAQHLVLVEDTGIQLESTAELGRVDDHRLLAARSLAFEPARTLRPVSGRLPGFICSRHAVQASPGPGGRPQRADSPQASSQERTRQASAAADSARESGCSASHSS